MADPGRRRGSLRARIVVVALFVVGVALVMAGVALVVSLDRSLRGSVRAEALARARAIALELDAGAPVLTTAGDPEESFVQVVGPDGGVVASSPNVDGRGAIVHLPPGESRVLDDVQLPERPFLIVAIGANGPGSGTTILVGRSLEDASDTVDQVRLFLVIAIPALLLVVGAVAGSLVGRALAPVAAIRDEVDAISVGGLDRRVSGTSGDDEIARLAATMNRMLERLEAGRTRERRFVSDASHELRSPVASIRQHAELAMRHPDRTDLPTLAAVAHEESLRLQRIVEDLLLLSRIDEGSVRLRRGPVDLDDLVQDEAARLRATSGARVVTDRVEAVHLEADRERLERLLRNLGENAARHARSAIALEVRGDDGFAILAVEDDGAGVPSADRERVFDRFVRLDEARRRDDGGTGLGLSIVREIVSLHGGVVTVADGELGGARFEVRLPIR